MSKEAMKQALEKIANALPAYIDGVAAREYLTVIHKALAEQPAQQEPVAWANPNDLQNFDMKVRTNGGPLHTMPLYTSPQPAQHPKTKQIAECLAVLRPTVKGKFPHEQALEELVGYIAAPQPAQRKPLTDEQIEREWQFLHDEEGNPPDHHDFARAIEAAHGITGKNT